MPSMHRGGSGWRKRSDAAWEKILEKKRSWVNSNHWKRFVLEYLRFRQEVQQADLQHGGAASSSAASSSAAVQCSVGLPLVVLPSRVEWPVASDGEEH